MKTVLLGDVAQIISGQSPQSSNYNKEGEGLPLYQGKKDFGAIFTADPTVWTTQTTKVAEKGDVLISVRAPVGPVNFASQKMNIGRGLAAIRPLDGLDSKYLYFFMKLNELELAKLGGGSTFDSINRSHLKNLNIPYPPVGEQNRVVKKLVEAFEKIDKAIELTQKNLQNSQELFQRSLDKIFSLKNSGWAEATIDQIAEVKGGKRVPRGYKLTNKKTSHPYIRVADFDHNGGIDPSDIRYISEDIFEKIAKYTISDSDLFLSIAGTIGVTGIVPKELDGANLTENACKLVLKKGIVPKFIYYFTLTNTFQDQAGLHTRTSAQPKLALIRIKTIKLRYPDEKAQQQVVRKMDSLHNDTQKLRKLYQQKLDNLQVLKKSLLAQAFKGEL